MTEQTPEPGAGDIELTLDGDEVVLRPTLRACLGISRMDESPMVTADKIARLNFDAVCNVIAFGLGVAPSKQLQERIFNTGVAKLTGPCIKFINIVNNGGKPLPNFDDDGDDKTEDGKEDDSGNLASPSE